jgi:siderophore synthetase component
MIKMRRETADLPIKHSEKRLINRLLHACVREQLLPHTFTDGLLFIPLKRNQKTLLAKNVQQFNLGKLNIAGDVMLIAQHQVTVIRNMRQFLELIYNEMKDVVDAHQWQQFVKEIDNCRTNEALVTSFVRNTNNQLAHDINQSKHKRFIDYVISRYSTQEQLIFFESWAAKGHPYHPCHKTKLGFSTKAYLKFSPEFNQDIDLPLAAIDKSLMHVESEQAGFDYNEWFAMQFPIQWQAWQAKLHEKGKFAADYCPLFIHPWQYENVLTKLFQPIIESGQLQLFKDIVITTKASLSFRTMIAKNNHQQPHIKLPVAVHSTSAMRTITPASVENGPKLGKILKAIFSVENNMEQHIKLAYESCGLHIKYPNPDIAKHLGIIYRLNPSTLVNKNELPIVVAALFEESPITKLPLFIEMMQAAVGESLSAAKDYFDNYCRVVIQAYLDLFLIYGIALEGHQQNTIAVFENYYPKYMIARDLGGLRIHASTLKENGFDYEAHPDSATISNDSQEVTNKFLHTVIQYHLGEIVLLLAQHYHAPESAFWKIVKDNLELRFQEIKNKVNKERWQQEYKAVLKDDWQIKGLMRMRLNNVYSKYIYIYLKNPLRDN